MKVVTIKSPCTLKLAARPQLRLVSPVFNSHPNVHRLVLTTLVALSRTMTRSRMANVCSFILSSHCSLYLCLFPLVFNREAGGVYAHLWDNSGIKVWFFSRKDIPADIRDKNPQPSTWGEPVAEFAADTCNMAEHFQGHSIVINTTLCGDFAGSAYPGPEEGGKTCNGSCGDAVADPSNFNYARWMINNVAGENYLSLLDCRKAKAIVAVYQRKP
jgi:hypothetical protein